MTDDELVAAIQEVMDACSTNQDALEQAFAEWPPKAPSQARLDQLRASIEEHR